MAQFKVNTEQMQNQATELGNLSATIEDVANRLAGIQISSAVNIAATTLLQLRIHGCLSAVQNHQAGLQNLSQTLTEISELYRQHENTIVSSANGEPTGGASGEQTPTDPTEGMTYEEILEYRASHAVDENTARLYEQYRNRVDINDDSYDGTAHYNGTSNEINYNAEDDASNVRGPGCTYYHEVGHLIDDQSDWNSYTSTDHSYDFYDCLSNDVDTWINNYMHQNSGASRDDAYQALSDWLYEDGDMKNGVSDIVRGITGGDASGAWGHSDGYYDEGSIAREAFAHFFEAGMSHDPTKLEYIREMFPSAYEEFQQMIQDELGN